MMKNEMSITEVCSQELDDEQVFKLWYDWFCKSSSLVNKGRRLLTKLKGIEKSAKFDSDRTYVFFKNNCPCCGQLYDDFRICDLESHDVVYTVIPKSGFFIDEGRGQVYGRENKFKEPLFEGSWREIKAWFLKEE